MQIPTNAGPITLAPSDIQNGMVFRDPTDNDTNTFRADPALYTDGIAGMQEVAEALAADVAAGKVYFLGCDPRLTSRAACERFGVSSTVDAHGFARLRDGGAVDMRQEDVPMGAIARGLCGRFGFNHRHLPRRLHVGEEFFGLRADIASPEDVRRFCCGADHPGDATVFGARCTLAIGDHEHHEDLATGVKWPTAVDPTKPKLIVGADLAQRLSQPSILKDGASPSPTGTTWPFKTLYGDFTFEAGIASLPCRASYCKDPNDIKLRFDNVPSGDNLFTLRDMFTQMGRVRFMLRAGDGTMARYEATPNEVRTSPNYRLADATNIETLLVDVKRVETADEYWSVQKPAPASAIIPDIRRAMGLPLGVRVRAIPKTPKSEYEKLEGFLAAEMSKAILGDADGSMSAGAVHDACAREVYSVPILKQSSGYKVWKWEDIPSPFTTSVKRHEALVPNGCDATRWRAVLNVIGADVTEAAQHRKRIGEAYDAERDISNRIVRTHHTLPIFAALRFVHGYDTKDATRRACERFVGTADHEEQARLCRVYCDA